LKHFFAALVCAFLAAGPAFGEPWPEKPIRLVVSFAPGGVHDTLARLLSPKLSEALGQPVAVENRGGAGGNIAADAVAKSSPDGYTFLVASEALATNEFLYRSLPYDLHKDLVPVAKLADFPMALVAHPSLPAAGVAELVGLARARPGEIHYGSAGIGTAGHLAGELLAAVAGVDLVHVPYKGGAPALQDLIAGRIQLMFLSVTLSAPQVHQGRLRALAVAGERRAEKLPEVPSTAEAGFPQLETLLFSSLFAPAGTPAAIVQRMSGEAGKALRAPDAAKLLAELGAVPAPSSPQEFARQLREIAARWGKLIRERNIRAD